MMIKLILFTDTLTMSRFKPNKINLVIPDFLFFLFFRMNKDFLNTFFWQ